MPGEATWQNYAGNAAYDAILGGMSTGGIVLAMLTVMVLYHSLRSPARFFPARVRSFLQRLAGWPFWTGMVLILRHRPAVVALIRALRELILERVAGSGFGAAGRQRRQRKSGGRAVGDEQAERGLGDRQSHAEKRERRLERDRARDLDGREQARYPIGHAQSMAIANLIPEREGLEIIVNTFWGAAGITAVLDEAGRLLHDFEPTGLVEVLLEVQDRRRPYDLVEVELVEDQAGGGADGAGGAVGPDDDVGPEPGERIRPLRLAALSGGLAGSHARHDGRW